MILHLTPLLHNREARLLYLGQAISFLGSVMTYIAMPWQMYQLTRSSFLVGLLAVAQLMPLITFALIGGAYADRLNRRHLLMISEMIMCLTALGLIVNSLFVQSHYFIFLSAILIQSANGFHRPAMDALMQKLLDPKDYEAIGTLNSFKYSFGAIVGPALGGLLISRWGVQYAYLFDSLTFLIAMLCVFP